MHRIDGPGATEDNKFTKGDPATGVPATQVTPEWLNAVQEELMAILEKAGISPDKNDNAQIVEALRVFGVGAKANDTATRDPGVGDDSNDGYSVGSRWINTSSGEVFRCVDATPGAASWAKTTLTLDELGSAATKNVGTSTGNVMEVGAFGLGNTGGAPTISDLTAQIPAGFYRVKGDAVGVPSTMGAGHWGLLIVSRTFGSRFNFILAEHTGGATTVYHGSRGDLTGPVIWNQVWTDDNLTKQSSPSDTTAGRVLTVGAFGLGSQRLVDSPTLVADLNAHDIPAGFWGFNSSTVGEKPGTFGSVVALPYRSTGSGNMITTLLATTTEDGLLYVRRHHNGWESEWREIFHSGSTVPSDNIQNQSAIPGATVTDALNNAPGMVLLAEYDVEATLNSAITINNIPQTFQHLIVRVIARSTSSGVQAIRLAVNDPANPSDNDWAVQYLNVEDATVSGDAWTTGLPNVIIGQAHGGDSAAGLFGSGEATLYDYTNTSRNVTVSSKGGAGGLKMTSASGSSTNQQAVTGIKVHLGGSSFASQLVPWAAGSRVEIWGIRGNPIATDLWGAI